MSAVRMVAYGVLELKHKEPPIAFLDAKAEAQQRKEDYERDQLYKLVNDELHRYGLLLIREVIPKNSGWRTKMNTFVLYGQLQGVKGFSTREVLSKGDFRSCCEVAAKVLDRLDAAQVPDTATGSD